MSSVSRGSSSIILSLLMVLLSQTSYVDNEGVQLHESIVEDEVHFTQSTLNLSTPFYPKTFVDGASFLDSVRPESMSSGYSTTCVVFDDQSLACSGYNYYGGLGIGYELPSPYTSSEHIKVNFPEDVKIKEAKNGYNSNCAIDVNDSLWCWGSNDYGQLGINSYESKSYSPQRVVFENNESIDGVAVGYNHKCALTLSNDIYCWGSNSNGQLHLPMNMNYVYSPVKVDIPNGITPVSITSKYDHTCLLSEEGAVYCWGKNDYGQLGDGTTQSRHVMSQVLLPFSDPAVSVKVGSHHSCALLLSGDLKCWGHNNYAQVGTKSSTPSSYLYPTSVVDLPIRPIDFDLGQTHTCALLLTQTILCWGLGNQGQLGDGTSSWSASSPNHHTVQFNAVGGNVFSNPVGIEVGYSSSCLVFEAGQVGCWGYNGYGQFGDGSNSNRQHVYPNRLTVGEPTQTVQFPYSQPHRISPFVDGLNFTTSIQPALPTGFTLDTRTGSLIHDGTGAIGSSVHNITFTAGTDTVTFSITVVVRDVLPYPGRVDSYLGGISLSTDLSVTNVASLSSTKDHTCMNQVRGQLLCWGDGEFGRLGTGSTGDELVPRTSSSSTSAAYQKIRDTYSVVTAAYHTCSLTYSGEVYCWGEGEDGRLGNGGTGDSISPVEVPFPNHRSVDMIASYDAHNCAITDDGEAHCWGKNSNGEIGQGYDSSYFVSPQEIQGFGNEMVSAISVGEGFSCAVLENGTTYCWGKNDFGQLGDGTTLNTNQVATPLTMPGAIQVTTISSGQSHSCAILQSGQVACWGRNNVGQLGDNSLTDRSTPVLAQLPTLKDAVMIDVGISHTCAVMDDGTMYCWGLNANGQLADGTTTFQKQPVRSVLPQGKSAVLVTTGEAHTCLLTADTMIYCIGSNSDGQLGDGTTNSRTDLVESHWNRNSTITSGSFTTGYSSDIRLLTSGWGSFDTTTSSLPPGYSVDVQQHLFSYDGTPQQTQNSATVTASNSVSSKSVSFTSQVYDFESLEGRISSFGFNAGFTSLDSEQALSVDTGFEYGCLLDHESRMKCWGYNANGELGRGHASTASSPEYVSDTNMKTTKAMAVGTHHTCSIDGDNKLWCWGNNGNGQIGDGTTSTRVVPTPVLNLGDEVMQVSTSAYHTCALTSTWNVYCWGINDYAQSGDSARNNVLTPNLINDFGSSRPISVSTGLYNTCLLFDNGSIGCFGKASEGVMGDGLTFEAYEQFRWPTLPIGRTAIALDLDHHHACAVMDDYSLYCWGNNDEGKVGNGSTVNVLTPTQILDSSYQVVGVSTSARTTCAWLQNGSGLCWGFNQYGQLGIGNTTNMDHPAWVLPHTLGPELKIVHLSTSHYQTCAQYDNGGLSCWGKANPYYSLGDATNTQRLQPSTFVYPPDKYSGTDTLGREVTFVSGFAQDKILQTAGWNTNVTLIGALPQGMTFNTSSLILSYDGTVLSSSTFMLQLRDAFGIQTLDFNFTMATIHPNEGRVNTPWLVNGSASLSVNQPQISSMSSEGTHTCMLDSNKKVSCWGVGSSGQLGYGSTSNIWYPKEVVNGYGYGDFEFSQISTGGTHTCALDNQSELLCWGYRQYYRLGDGSNSGTINYPYRITSDSEIYGQPLAALSVGGTHSCVIRMDSTTWCWGYGNYGQIGDGGSYGSGTMPKQVQFENNLSAISISTGYFHSCAILSDNSMYCWGFNDQGQLGIGNFDNQLTPSKVQLPQGRTALTMSLGNSHTCAILDDSSIRCWGNNDNGQIGDGTTDDRNAPSSVILSGLNNPIQISSGYDSTCALFDDGSLQCWGSNDYGQLGIGSTTQSSSPQSLNSISHLEASSVTVGNYFACALFHDGSPRCWGLGTSGQLGTALNLNSNVPILAKDYFGAKEDAFVFVQGTTTSIPVHVAGWDFASTLISALPPGLEWNHSTNSIRLDGRLPIGNYTVTVQFTAGSYTTNVGVDVTIIERIDPWSDRVPSHTHGMAILDDVDSTFPQDLDVGGSHSCYISVSKYNYCQGLNSNGQLGEGSTTQRTTPYKISTFEQPLMSISAGPAHTCAITFDGSLYCWGSGNTGELGIGSAPTTETQPREVTIEANGLEYNKALQVEVGTSHSCSLFDDLQLYCWGYNNYGQLGINSLTQQTRPQVVSLPLEQRATDVSLGNGHTCAIVLNGSVYCWGYNAYGQLGDNTTTNSPIPILTHLPQGRTAIAISLGNDHSCAILDNNSVYCWGYNGNKQLGSSMNPSRSLIPLFAELPTGSSVVELSMGTSFSCAVLANGSAYCWGYNNYNQVEGQTNSNLPNTVLIPVHVELESIYRIVSLSIGSEHACAVLENGEITCWGRTSNNQDIELNKGSNPNELRYVISEQNAKRLHPIGWGILDYSISNLPNGFTFESSYLEIRPNATLTGTFDWSVSSLAGNHQGTTVYQGINIDRKQGAKPAWTNSISYVDSNSELPMETVDTNYRHSCGIQQGGELFCWGLNDQGQLGDGTTTRRLRPTAVRYEGATPLVNQVSTGYHNTCIVTDANRVMCWGDGTYGQNGIGSYSTDGTEFDQKRPKEVLLSWDVNATMVSTGRDFACALIDDGAIRCWGKNNYGQLGIGSTSPSYSGLPQTVQLPVGRFALSIDAVEEHACAVLDDGSMYCWGNHKYGNMGTGQLLTSTNSYISTPIPVELPPGKRVSLMAVGNEHSCALMTDDSLWCWGRNYYGEIGNGNIATQNSEMELLPVEVDVQYYSPIVALSAGYRSTCSLHDDGMLNCWGWNNEGQVGDGLSNDQSTPTTIQLEGSTEATWISSGYQSTCATGSDGSAQCWGNNDYGRLGDGTTEQRSSPGRIDMDLPSTALILTFLEGEITQNENFVAGWNYSFAVSPPLPLGFSMNLETGTIFSTGNSTFGVTRHNVSALAGPYVSTVEISIAVIRDTDGDGTPDAEDYDDDDDGNLDSLDNCPSQFGTSSLGGYIGCPDSDGDGWADLIDPFDDDVTQWKDTDGDGYGDNPNGTSPDLWILDSSQWFDTDGDGYGDNEFGIRGDSCPQTEGYSTIDVYGCLDSDSDGWSDTGDSFPFNTSQWVDRDGDGWGDNQSQGAELVDVFPSDGTQWADADGDGHGDNKYGTEGDWFPDNPDRWADTDRDGTADEDDAFVNDATQSTDSDGDLYGDDPLGNRADEFPNDPTEWKDTDGDGVGNNADAFPFDPTQTTDRDGDGYGDNPLGSGADIFPDNPTQWVDLDDDGLGDNLTGTDADPYLNDFDNDGYNDSIDVLPSFYSPGDLDNDGVLDIDDWDPADYREWADFDGDGKGDNEDPDDDNDGYADTDEIRQKTDPYDSNAVPIESFEIVIPGTSVGLGAWDLIGMFGGIPLFSWIMFGFVTRNKRCAKFENLLNNARSRDELEQIALKWEYSLMLRMLGPHQGIRLERLRSELDDYFENHELSLAYTGQDHTRLVEKQIPAIQSTIETDLQTSNQETQFIQNVQQAPVQRPHEPQSQLTSSVEEVTQQETVPYVPPPAGLVLPQNLFNQNTAPPVAQAEAVLNTEDAASLLSSPPPTPEAAVVRTVVENLPLPSMVPASSTPATSTSDGYEWLTQGELNYFRLAGSQTEWTLWQG